MVEEDMKWGMTLQDQKAKEHDRLKATTSENLSQIAKHQDAVRRQRDRLELERQVSVMLFALESVSRLNYHRIALKCHSVIPDNLLYTLLGVSTCC